MTTKTTEFENFGGSDSLDTGGGVHPYVRRLIGFLERVLACVEVDRQRRQLMSLDDRALEDMGISRAAAQREAMRGFWDLPDHRKPGR